MKRRANISQGRSQQPAPYDSISFLTDFITAISSSKRGEEGLCIIKMTAIKNGTAEDYLFLKVSPLFEKLTGIENANGKKLGELASPDEKTLRKLLHKISLLHNPMHFEYHVKSENTWLEVQGCCQSPQILIWLKDITGRKRTEQLSVEKNKLMELAASGESIEKCLTELTNAITRLSPNTKAAVLLANEARKKFESVYSNHFPASFGHGIDGTPINDQVISTCGSAVYEGRAFSSSDIMKDKNWSEPWRELCLSHNIRACHSEPVMDTKNKAIASLMLCFNETREATPWEKQVLAFGIHIAALIIERGRTEVAVRKAKEKYQLLFNSIDEGFFICEVIFKDEVPVDIRYLEANPAAIRMTGTESKVGPTEEPDLDFDDRWYEIFGRVARTGTGERHELPTRSLQTFYNVYIFKVGEPDDTKVAAIYRDITEYRRQETNHDFLTEIQDDLARLNSAKEVMQTVGEKIGSFLNIPFLFLAERDGKQDNGVHYLWKKETAQISDNFHIPNRLITDLNNLFPFNQPFAINDTTADDRLNTAAFEDLQIRAVLGISFQKKGKWVSTLMIGDPLPRHWHKEEAGLFRELANRLFLRLERAHAEEARRTSEAKLSIEVKAMKDLYDSSTRLRTVPDIRTALEEILHSSIGLMDAQFGNIQLYDEHHKMLRLTVLQGFNQAFYNTFHSVSVDDNTTCGRAIRTGKRVIIRDILEDALYAPYIKDALAAGYRSIQTTPLYDREGHLLGALSTHWRRPHSPSEQALRTLDLYARLAADFIIGVRDREQLLQSEAHLSALFAEAEVGLSEISLDGHFLRVNDKLCRILGRSRKEILQLNVSDVISKKDVAHNLAIIKQLIQTGKPVSLDKRYIRPDGELVWANSALSLLDKTKERPRSILAVTADITDRKILDRQKDEFIGVASHELKTPVTSIKIYAEILEENLNELRDKENAVLAGKQLIQANRIIKILNDLLDTSRIFEDRFLIQPRSFDLNQLIKENVDNLQALAPNIPLIIRTESIQPVIADPERIAQVLTNLISNAIKYSPSGGKITISSENSGDGVTVRIKDSGLGMSLKTQKNAFNRFYRAGVPNINMNNFPGMGLGLYIASEIIKRHQGNIGLHSKPGEGSEFYFKLPYHF